MSASKDEILAKALVSESVNMDEKKDELNPPVKSSWKQRIFRLIFLIIYLSICYLLDFIHINYFPHMGSTGNSNMNVLASNKFLGDVNMKFQRGTDVPFFWHVPKSGGTSIKNMYSQCYGMVEASESGIANGRPKEAYLQVVEVEQGKYVNVDVTTEDGIDHAASLKLVDSNLADIVVSPLLHKATTSLLSENRKGRLMTIFRHPIDRVISIFYYLQKATWEPTYNPIFKNMTLRDYAFSQYAESNFVARSLLNKMEVGQLTKSDVRTCKKILADKFVIGFLDDLENSVKRFDSYFGFNAVHTTCKEMYLKKGVNRRDGSNVDTESRDFKLAYDELKRKNWLDMDLYDYVHEFYRKQGELFAK